MDLPQRHRDTEKNVPVPSFLCASVSLWFSPPFEVAGLHVFFNHAFLSLCLCVSVVQRGLYLCFSKSQGSSLCLCVSVVQRGLYLFFSKSQDSSLCLCVSVVQHVLYLFF